MSWDDAVDGVDRDTPGGRMPRAWTVAARLRAANDDIAHAMVADGLPAYAEDEVKLLLIEPRGVLNTGAEGGERTAINDLWI